MSRPHGSSQKTLIAQALKAERDVSAATSQRQALEAAIDAAEHYMKALSLAATTQDKQSLDVKCKEWLSRAEKIKEAKDWRSAIRVHDRHAAELQKPVSTRTLTTREEIILLEGAKLNGFIFPPWAGPPSLEEFEPSEGGQLFIDKPDLHLSDKQKDIFDGWKRPSELLAKHAGGETSVMSVPENTDLVQDVLTDCSVVASLCATTSRSERGLDKRYLPLIYPCEYDTSHPKASPSGRYILRFYFNGCFRKVVIDDRLPSSKTSRSLYVIDRNNPNFLWPALVEKAYLKLRGGYDFPGSNSGTDLWVLTGWIPEQVFLHHEDVTSDQIWKRLFRSFQFGDVLLTIGTGKLTEREEEELGLVSEHDYAILDMKEFKGRRQMLVKNPWAGVHTADGSTENALESNAPHDRSSLSPGTFWMDCEVVLQNFENLYLNWSPRLFKYRQDIHFTWDLAAGKGVPGCFVKNPQFAVTSETGGTVWLLLGKHFRTIDHPGYSLSENAQAGFISIYVFNADGKRVSLSDGALHRGPYVDSPNTLMRLEMPPRTTYTAVVSEESLPTLSQNFTLSALSISPVHIAPSQNKYMCVSKVQSSWMPSTAGGNAESARYPTNPQFTLTLSNTTDISILLESSDTDLAIHAKLFFSNGKRVTRVRNRDIITDSGDYRRGAALAEKRHLDKGVYTIVCSTFAPDQLGRFTLWVSSMVPCEVKPLAPEAAGRRAVISDIGVLPPGRDRMLAPLQVPRLTRIKLIARSRRSTIGSHPVGPSPVLMTIELGQGPYKEVLATSEDGDHSDAISGVRIEDFDLHPDLEDSRGVWIVLERIGGPGGQVEDHFEVEALAEERVEIGECLKSADIGRFAARAAQIERVKPVVAYWCNYWIANQIIERGLHRSDHEVELYAMDLMEKLEQFRNENSDNDTVIDAVAANAYVEQFGLEVFNRADTTMRANKVTKQTADTFQAAATFLELCQIWNPLEPEIAAKIKFAKYHALRIVKAIKAGEDPNATNPVVKEDDETEGPTVTEDDLEAQADLVSQPQQPTVEEVPDESERAERAMARQSSLDESLHPSRSSSAPRPQRTIDSFTIPDVPTSAPRTPAPETGPTGEQGSTLNLPSAPVTFASSSSIPNLPDTPSNLGAHHPAASNSFHSFPPPSDLPPASPPATFHQPSSFYNHPKPSTWAPSTPAQPDTAPVPVVSRPVQQPAPAAVPTVSASSQSNSHGIDDQAIAQAQKHARWAVSALTFDDVNTAIKELKNSLKYLGAE
ncbi:uncharacterized protein CDV56_108742 [Aspergillus thermomutatus]|uniref:Calpain catalytic domain-containing protein n=1 Tax=Aspergillus thermomutatus TaxID=41047 RepID=A0A397HYT5_ASPTH|nr:uncharacterized protein CDV56_108742 [Aspergillus thermomutatus]RHZ66364.1 hypothetical protein CDV56_108742 [Aspergillus thermomutatus]